MSKEAAVLRMMMADSFEIKFDNEGELIYLKPLFRSPTLMELLFLWALEDLLRFGQYRVPVTIREHTKILQSNGPPKFILKKSSKYSND